MNEVIRRKSPRAPSIALDEALERTLRVYGKEKRHPTPTEVVAQDIGYKSANNGAALSVLASLRYYGLLERPEDGKLSVAKDVENYQFAPDQSVKKELLLKWLRAPPVFADLLDRYPGGLPSDANLRFDLMARGFSPTAAASVISVFRRSADFINMESPNLGASIPLSVESSPENSKLESLASEKGDLGGLGSSPASLSDFKNDVVDKIPVRLSAGRRAWLIIPTPFFESDKIRLKAQIDLLLSEDHE